MPSVPLFTGIRISRCAVGSILRCRGIHSGMNLSSNNVDGEGCFLGAACPKHEVPWRSTFALSRSEPAVRLQYESIRDGTGDSCTDINFCSSESDWLPLMPFGDINASTLFSVIGETKVRLNIW